LAGPEDLERCPGLVPGYLGPQLLASLNIRYLVDPLIADGSAWVTGANQSGRHAIDVVRGRDFVPDGEVGAVEITDGDLCSLCDAPLRVARGIELGHVFQLGRKYAEVFGLEVLGSDGKPIVVTMGSYGIGISRAVAALAEQTLDDLGLCWPRSVSPADVHLVATGKGDAPFEAGESLATYLQASGVGVLYDDRRGVSPGVKFRDAELIGIPTIVTAGRGLGEGLVEVRDRATNERRDLPLATAVEIITQSLRTTRSPIS
jgi:prolyl-tRNA synthetase